MPSPRSPRPPWLTDPNKWGRVRLNEDRWRATTVAVKAYLSARREYHRSLPNPSPEGRASLEEIRELQKVLDTLDELAIEKGWG